MVGMIAGFCKTWWRHQMETFSALLAHCVGNSPVTGEFPAQRPVTRSFAVFFDLHLNKRLSKQSWGWWFETSSRTLCRHCNEIRSEAPIIALQCFHGNAFRHTALTLRKGNNVGAANETCRIYHERNVYISWDLGGVYNVILFYFSFRQIAHCYRDENMLLQQFEHPSWKNMEYTRCTVRCRYYAVNFLQNAHKKHPITRPLGRAMGCLLYVKTPMDILPQSLKWRNIMLYWTAW